MENVFLVQIKTIPLIKNIYCLVIVLNNKSTGKGYQPFSTKYDANAQ